MTCSFGANALLYNTFAMNTNTQFYIMPISGLPPHGLHPWQTFCLKKGVDRLVPGPYPTLGQLGKQARSELLAGFNFCLSYLTVLPITVAFGRKP